jgi:hypothetical protein
MRPPNRASTSMIVGHAREISSDNGSRGSSGSRLTKKPTPRAMTPKPSATRPGSLYLRRVAPYVSNSSSPQSAGPRGIPLAKPPPSQACNDKDSLLLARQLLVCTAAHDIVFVHAGC